jgi:hypothetical protein
MRVAFLTTFAASKQEPLIEVVGRVRQAFLDAGMPEPAIRFTLIDAPRTSSIDRVLKRHPEMERFLTFRALIPGSSESRLLSNSATGEAAEYSTLQAIAAGVPHSYPFGIVALHFHTPAFGERLIGLPKFGHSLPGVLLVDNRSIKGRQRALSVNTVVEVDAADKKLPPNPAPVDAVIKACGKIKRTEQVPIREPGAGLGGRLVGAIPPANVEAVKAIVAGYRARINEVVERAALPHDLPSASETQLQNPGVTAGPRKPAIEAAFKSMGYACRGGSGQFHLTRRTSGNLTVELFLDVGTWSHDVSASFLVQGAGLNASLGIPVGPKNAPGGQYPIGDAAQWQKIVENLAAMVRELERGFVPEVEQAAGPSPAWYRPPS